MKDVMLDLETLGNGKNCAICQIGACYFDRNTGEIGATFKVNVDANSSVQSGGELDASTVYWWLAQSEEARQSILKPPLISLSDSLDQLNEFLKDANCIWSHATFDFVAITESYKRLNKKQNFSYRTARDIRTLIELTKISVKDTPRTGIHHDALYDCFHQVKYCCAAFEKLNTLKKLNEKLKGFV